MSTDTALAPLDALALLRDLKEKRWTTDEWVLFYDALKEDPETEELLQAHWDDGYETGKQDGEPKVEEAYEEGHADGVTEAEDEAKEELSDLRDIVALALPYVEEEAKLPNYKPGAVAPLLARMRRAVGP